MRDLSIADFAPAIGETFDLDHGGSRIGLVLEQARELPRSMREAGAFRLQFRGPRDPLLPQAIYSLERGGEAHDIFIVPIAQGPETTTYEAIFN